MRKNSIKNTRINSEVMREISQIIRTELKDPRVSTMTSVTDVNVTTDLKYCTVYVSVLGDKEESTDNNLLKWCNGSYQLSYHIKDKKTLSIKNRDLYLSNVMTQIQSFWNESSIESLIAMDKENIETKLGKIAEANSNEDITFSIVKGKVYFDYSDEAMLSE